MFGGIINHQGIEFSMCCILYCSTENPGNNEVKEKIEDAEAPETKNDEERSSGKKFKEKVIKTNLAATTDEPVAFKKRKSKSRNMRKRDDDD